MEGSLLYKALCVRANMEKLTKIEQVTNGLGVRDGGGNAGKR